MLVICSSDEPSHPLIISDSFRPHIKQSPTTLLSTHQSNRSIHNEKLQLHPHPSYRQCCQRPRVRQDPCQGQQVLQESRAWYQGCEVSRFIAILSSFVYQSIIISLQLFSFVDCLWNLISLGWIMSESYVLIAWLAHYCQPNRVLPTFFFQDVSRIRLRWQVGGARLQGVQV
jgi:hypothetical protein